MFSSIEWSTKAFSNGDSYGPETATEKISVEYNSVI